MSASSLPPMPADDNPIIGGDTPFVPASESYRAFGKDHAPIYCKIDGKEATRELQLTVCAMMWRMEEVEPHLPEGMTHREFMRSFVAGANHDLRALGLGPLISMTEVEHWAAHPDIVTAIDKSRNADV
jgi:hypothetical protein